MKNDVVKVTKQTPIEIALGIDEEGYTTARKLYSWLGLDFSNFSRWVKENILDNPFVDEKDFSSFMTKTNGRPSTDYKITAKLAKKLSMLSRTERGEQAKNYFIGCEQALVKIAKKQAEENHKKEIARIKGIATRKDYTTTIKESKENERMHGHAYSTYTDVIYKAVFDKNAKQLRREYGISKKDNLRDRFSSEEIARIDRLEDTAGSLMRLGLGYEEIKDFIMSDRVKSLIGEED